MARDILVTALGTATKLIPYLNEQRKVYRARLVLGVTTDTQDTTGRVLSQAPGTRVTREELTAVLKDRIGLQEQIPPMFSAVKVNGEPLYKKARRGRVVSRKKRPVTIYRLEFYSESQPVYTFKEGPELLVECSKGTYIRTLCHDIGRALGCGGCMGELERSASDRKSTRLNSSHVRISYAVFGLKKKRRMPALLALNNDLVTTLPLQVADMQAEAASLVVLEPPCKIPSFESTMAWSPLLQHHSAH